MMPEISLNILDVAENSVRAEASLIEIYVEENTTADTLTVIISDNGRGMDAQTVAGVTDPFYTTRATRRVGLGLPFYRMAAELTGGDLRITSKPGEGTVVTATFGLSHIDRMPLGDINGTVATLIHCNPEIDFIYCHAVDGRVMRLDTKEFRDVLGDIPLNTPEVAAFINEYLKENSKGLYV